MERYGTPTDDMPDPRDERHPQQDIPERDSYDDPQPAVSGESDRPRHEADDQSGTEPGGAAESSQAYRAGHPDPRSEGPSRGLGSPGEGQQYSSLLSDREAGVFLDRWREVQARFVDDPRTAVQDGDALVAELMRSLADRFGEQKGALEEQWNSGGEPETEQLRLALQEYRSFFNRLLST